MFNAFFKHFKKVEAKDMVEDAKGKYQRMLLEHSESAALAKKMAEFYAEGLERLAAFKTP